jgi:hypothetical protein
VGSCSAKAAVLPNCTSSSCPSSPFPVPQGSVSPTCHGLVLRIQYPPARSVSADAQHQPAARLTIRRHRETSDDGLVRQRGTKAERTDNQSSWSLSSRSPAVLPVQLSIPIWGPCAWGAAIHPRELCHLSVRSMHQDPGQTVAPSRGLPRFDRLSRRCCLLKLGR